MTAQYAHLFASGGDEYLFIKNLGTGFQSSAQLVLHLQSGELCVQKVAKRRLPEAARQDPDREEAALTVLQDRISRAEPQPNIVRFYKATDVVSRRESPEVPKRWHRESYFQFWNGGDLRSIYRYCKDFKLVVPRRLILKPTQQIVSALDFLYTSDPPVFHYSNDLHMGNIFLNWRQDSQLPVAYIGDFVMSMVGGPILGDWSGDLESLLYHAKALMKLTGETVDKTDGEVLPHLEHAIAELGKLVEKTQRDAPSPAVFRRAREAGESGQVPPDMTEFLSLLSTMDIPSSGSQDLRRVFEVSVETPGLRTYDSLEEFLQARNVLGPWFLAQIPMRNDAAPIEVSQRSERAYHRPNAHNHSSDTESVLPSSGEDSSNPEFLDDDDNLEDQVCLPQRDW